MAELGERRLLRAVPKLYLKVVKHYDRVLALRLVDCDKHDLVEFLKSI
jgi:hypothetical protein